MGWELKCVISSHANLNRGVVSGTQACAMDNSRIYRPIFIDGTSDQGSEITGRPPI